MVWFKVDDTFHSHPKATACSLAALGLWTAAGSWSGGHLTDGFVSDRDCQLLARGESALADELVAARLWKRTKGGYRFHEWVEDSDGTERNPTAKQVKEKRQKRAEAGRKGGLASGKSRSKTASNDEASASAGASSFVEPPSRPVPFSGGDFSRGGHLGNANAKKPPEKCPQHINDPKPPPCGACGDARRALETWNTTQKLATTRCRHCDGDGYRWDPAGRHRGPTNTRCDHHPPDRAEAS